MPEAQDDPYYDARLELVKQVNRDRASAGLPPVELDIFSSLVADRHCQEMAAYRYLSHWNLRGLLPYHRYHAAGGRDHVQENLSRMTEFSSDPFPIRTEPPRIVPYLLEAQGRFLAEKPPLDGHRRNVLDPAHTHVGVGLAVVGPEFAMAEEFLNRYVRLAELPATFRKNPITVEGEMLRKDFGPYYCMLFYEGAPKSRSVEELGRTYYYSDSEGDQCASVKPWEMDFDRARGRFRFSVQAKNCGPGYYHLLLWVRDRVRSIPYELIPGTTNKIDTKEAVLAAGWVFRL